MRADVEVYRGIEFVRLSSLPDEHRKLISNSLQARKVIKILRGTEVLTDCLPYKAYLEWHEQYASFDAGIIRETPVGIKDLNLVFK